MTDREFTRFTQRVAMFTRRGWAPDRAEAFADTALARDRSRDDRHACIECEALMRNGGCRVAQRTVPTRMVGGQQRYRSALPGATSADSGAYMFTPVQDVLHRCEGFSWLTK